MLVYLFIGLLIYLQVCAPSGNRDQRFSFYANRGQETDKNWGAAEWESQNTQNRFQQSRASVQRSLTPATAAHNWSRPTSSRPTVPKKFDFNIPNWSSSSEDNSPRICNAAPTTYEFNLSESD